MMLRVISLNKQTGEEEGETLNFGATVHLHFDQISKIFGD